jgi:hypothetical protein
MAIDNKDIISMNKSEIPKGELEFLMKSAFNTILSNKNRALRYFVIYEEGDTVIDIPDNFQNRILFLEKLINYFESTEEYEKCQELFTFKSLAKRSWGIK